MIVLVQQEGAEAQPEPEPESELNERVRLQSCAEPSQLWAAQVGCRVISHGTLCGVGWVAQEGGPTDVTFQPADVFKEGFPWRAGAD